MKKRSIAIMSGSFFVILASVFSGCKKDTAELEKNIVSYDPSFREMLERRDSLRKEKDGLASEYNKDRESIEKQISALKIKKESLKREYLISVENVRGKMAPEKRALNREIIAQENTLRINNAELSDIESDIEEITALVGKKDDLSLSQEEMKTWNKRLSSLMERRSKLNGERKRIHIEIEMLKMKLKVLDV